MIKQILNVSTIVPVIHQVKLEISLKDLKNFIEGCSDIQQRLGNFDLIKYSPEDILAFIDSLEDREGLGKPYISSTDKEKQMANEEKRVLHHLLRMYFDFFSKDLISTTGDKAEIFKSVLLKAPEEEGWLSGDSSNARLYSA